MVDRESTERQLRRRRAELDAQLARLVEDEQSVLRDRGDGSADDEHDPEGSTLSGEWTRIDAIRRGIRSSTAEIDAALSALASGTFGVCEVCGRAIAPERLEARPMATRCVQCAA